MTMALLQTLIGLIFVGVGIEMANKAPTTQRARWIYRSIFIFLGLVLLAFTWIQYGDQQRKEKESAKQIQTLNINQTNLEHTFKTKIDVLQTNLSAFQEEQQNIEMQLATNSAYDPNLRERIIASHEKYNNLNLQTDDLNAWAAGLRGHLKDKRAAAQIQKEKEMAANQAFYKQNLPYFEDAIMILTNLLGKAATQIHDKAVVTYGGLPTIIAPDVVETNVGEIKFQTNADWDFKISIGQIHPNPTRRPLVIRCKVGDIIIWVGPGGVETFLTPSGRETDRETGLIADYPNAIGADYLNTIEDALRLLIAEEYELSASTNK